MTSPKFSPIKEQFIQILSTQQTECIPTNGKEREIVSQILETILTQMKLFLSNYEKDRLIEQLLREVIWPYRALEPLIKNPQIEEIMVNGYQGIYVKYRTEESFTKTTLEIKDVDEMQKVIEKLLEGTGRRVDKSQPMIDLRLSNGSRANIIIEPISINGPAITIRKFTDQPISLDDLIEKKMLSTDAGIFLSKAVSQKANILLSGGTATGKTTFLSALTEYFHKDERVIIVEDTCELQLNSALKNVIRLETRPANTQQTGEITIQDLLKNALRMRPERILVGEVRGKEAFDMLQAMNTGHPGSFTSIHANSPSDALDRLEALVLLAGFQELPLSVIRKWIENALDIVIQLKKYPEGRRVSDISWVHNNSIIPLFSYKNGLMQQQKMSPQRCLDQLKTKQ